MENSQDKVVGEGFGADDGASGVVSLLVPGYTPPVTGSSSPVTSEGGVVPSLLLFFLFPFLFFRLPHVKREKCSVLVLYKYFAILLLYVRCLVFIGWQKTAPLRQDRTEVILFFFSMWVGVALVDRRHRQWWLFFNGCHKKEKSVGREAPNGGHWHYWWSS
jgi:hypothetical protein